MCGRVETQGVLDISLGLFRFEVVPEDMIWALELMWVPFLKVNLLLGPVV